ncbi:MAG: peroxiredoxin family protein [Deferrisomatales bacterium]
MTRRLPVFALIALTLAAAPGTSLGASESTALKGKQGAAPGGMIAVGADPIPFTLQDLDGKTVNLADFLGKKAVLLTFWSFFCGPCREELPQIDELAKRWGSKGLEVLAINLDGPKLEKAVRKYVEPFSFRVVWEQIEGVSYKTADAYGVMGTPSVLLIAKSGKVQWTHVGREEVAAMDAEVRKALGVKD